jgi:hypothetical protein
MNESKLQANIEALRMFVESQGWIITNEKDIQSGYQLVVTLRQGLKPHGFFGLSSVVGTLRSVPWGRLGERRSGGGKARHEYLHSDLHDQAVPGPLLFPCLVQRDEWPTACSWHPGEKQHPRLSTLSPWERTHTGGGFPCAIVVRTTLPKPVDWVPVASLCQIAHTVVQHGSVFTAGPSPANPYTFQLFKVLWVYSHRGAKKWKCIREWLKPRTPNYRGRDPVAYGGLKPFSVSNGVTRVPVAFFYSGKALIQGKPDESYLNTVLREKGREITIVQQTHAEEDISVAAASIFARAEFVRQLKKLDNKVQA